MGYSLSFQINEFKLHKSFEQRKIRNPSMDSYSFKLSAEIFTDFFKFLLRLYLAQAHILAILKILTEFPFPVIKSLFLRFEFTTAAFTFTIKNNVKPRNRLGLPFNTRAPYAFLAVLGTTPVKMLKQIRISNYVSLPHYIAAFLI